MDSKMVNSSEQPDWSLFIQMHLRSILEDDDKDSFMDIINGLLYKLEVFPTEIMSCIIGNFADEIGTAVLNGETCLKPMDVNAVDPDQLTLLHKAAAVHNYYMVDALLSRGARTDLRYNCNCNCRYYHYLGMTPLNLALDGFSFDMFMSKWTPKHSLFNLIIRLCNPFKAMHSLPVARLLFFNTEGTEYDIYRYAKAGKVLELAALLLVAPEKVFSSSIFEKITNYSCPRGSKTLRQYTTSEIASLTALRMRLVHEIGSYALLQTCNDKLAIMRSLLMLLEVFERVGDKITTYVNQQTPQRDDTREAAKKLGWLIQESGFALDYADLDIYYLNSSKNRDVGEVLHSAVKSKICREKSLDLRLPDCMEPSNLHHCFKKPKGKGKLWSLRWSVTVKQDGKVLNAKKPAQRTFPGLGWQFSIPSKRHPYWGTWSVWAFSTSTKVEATIATTKALVPYEKVPLFKQYAHVALPILRRVVLG